MKRNKPLTGRTVKTLWYIRFWKIDGTGLEGVTEYTDEGYARERYAELLERAERYGLLLTASLYSVQTSTLTKVWETY